MTNETRQLAQFAAELRHEQIPARTRQVAIDLLIDQLGVQIGCSEMPWAKQIWETYRRDGGTPEATVVRYGDRLPVDAAAFINSTFGHSFEYDDANPLAHAHAGAEILPALIAMGEREHSSGRELLTTFVAAYEIRGRLGWALAPDPSLRGGPHYCSMCGPFASAAGVGRLLGLGAEGMHNAMAIAGCFSGGLEQYVHGGGSVKRIFAALAASSGVKAAQMAQGGITGPEGILEGGHGLLRVYADNYRPHLLVAELGEKWTIEYATLKPYCCCALIHPAIDAIKKVVSLNHLKAEDIAAIEVGYAKASCDHAAITEPKDLLGMQFSTSYAMAIAVLKGRNTPREYTESTLKDKAIAELSSKVTIVADEKLEKYYGEHRPARVKVRTKSGQAHEEVIIDAKGTRVVPLSKEDVEEKFRSQVADVVGAEDCEKLLHTLYHIDTLDDVSTLLPMLVAKKALARAKEVA